MLRLRNKGDFIFLLQITGNELPYYKPKGPYRIDLDLASQTERWRFDDVLVLNWQLNRQFALSLLCPDNHLDGCGHGGIVDIVSSEGRGDSGAAPERVG